MRATWPSLTQLVSISLFAVLFVSTTTGCNNSATPPVNSASAAAQTSSAPVSVAPPPTSASVALASLPKTAQSYQTARYDPIHFKPEIFKASDAQCLACHSEVLESSMRKTSIAGLETVSAKAWYQQFSTYQGEQDTFHRRHLVTPYAKQVMNLHCNTCHQGSDPKDQVSGTSATTQGDLTMRKTVVPETTCLKCHGQMNWPVMGLTGPWADFKEAFQNNCVTACHSFQRTVRHQVNYLNAKVIEELAAKPNGADVCLGCHGGRSWYRVVYPYPRHAWPNMPTETPVWAVKRPTQSEARFRLAIAPVPGASAPTEGTSPTTSEQGK